MASGASDNSRFIGLHVKASCLLLMLIICPMYLYILHFSPGGLASYALMGLEIIITIVGIISLYCNVRIILIVYLVAQILMTIASWISVAYIIFALANVGAFQRACAQNHCPSSYPHYIRNLLLAADEDSFYLWLAIAFAFIGTAVLILLVAGFRKLWIFNRKNKNMQRTVISIEVPDSSRIALEPAQAETPVLVSPDVETPALTPSVIPQKPLNALLPPVYGNLSPQGFPQPGNVSPFMFSQGLEPPPAYQDLTFSYNSFEEPEEYRL